MLFKRKISIYQGLFDNACTKRYVRQSIVLVDERKVENKHFFLFEFINHLINARPMKYHR